MVEPITLGTTIAGAAGSQAGASAAAGLTGGGGGIMSGAAKLLGMAEGSSYMDVARGQLITGSLLSLTGGIIEGHNQEDQAKEEKEMAQARAAYTGNAWGAPAGRGLLNPGGVGPMPRGYS